MTDEAKDAGATAAADPNGLLCPRCLGPLEREADQERDMVGCRTCPGGRLEPRLRFYVARRGPGGPRDLSCARCGIPVSSFSSALYTCPACGTRHALAPGVLDAGVRAKLLEPGAREQLARHHRRFASLVVALFVAIVTVLAAALVRSSMRGRH